MVVGLPLVSKTSYPSLTCHLYFIENKYVRKSMECISRTLLRLNPTVLHDALNADCTFGLQQSSDSCSCVGKEPQDPRSGGSWGRARAGSSHPPPARLRCWEPQEEESRSEEAPRSTGEDGALQRWRSRGNVCVGLLGAYVVNEGPFLPGKEQSVTEAISCRSSFAGPAPN